MGSDILAQNLERTENPVHHPRPTRIQRDKRPGKFWHETHASEEDEVFVLVEGRSGVGESPVTSVGRLLESFG